MYANWMIINIACLFYQYALLNAFIIKERGKGVKDKEEGLESDTRERERERERGGGRERGREEKRRELS